MKLTIDGKKLEIPIFSRKVGGGGEEWYQYFPGNKVKLHTSNSYLVLIKYVGM